MDRLRHAGPGTIERPEVESTPGGSTDSGWRVVVFDNDFNTVDEVVMILMIATECPQDEACMETWEVHHLGKSIVHYSGEKECRRVAEVISTIGIRVEVSATDL